MSAKSLVIGSSLSVESFIIFHACKTPFWQFLRFYDFYTSESAAACDCQRLCYRSRDSLPKKIHFFPLRVFGPPEYPCPRSTSNCPTAQSAPVHACLWSLLFFLFFVIGGGGGGYFPLPPQVAVYLVTQLGLGLPDPNPNPKPNPNDNLHLKKLPLPIIASQVLEIGVYESTMSPCNLISLVQQRKWIISIVFLTTPWLQ